MVPMQITHFRSGSIRAGEATRGGMTVAIFLAGETVYGAIGLCGHKHTFNRKLGRTIAEGRVLVNGDVVTAKFGQVFDRQRFGADTAYEMAFSIAHILIRESHLKGKQLQAAKKTLEFVESNMRIAKQLGGRQVLPNAQFDIQMTGVTSGRIQSAKPNHTKS